VVGLGFFDDPLRMDRDLLADAARDYLSRLLGQPDRAVRDGDRSALSDKPTRRTFSIIATIQKATVLTANFS
jgi:hypothetical protein